MSSRWEEITEELYNKLKSAEKERRVAFLQIEEFSSDQSIDAWKERSKRMDMYDIVFGFGWMYLLVLPFAPFAIVGIVALSILEIWQVIKRK
jgi:hypothetical protein